MLIGCKNEIIIYYVIVFYNVKCFTPQKLQLFSTKIGAPPAEEKNLSLDDSKFSKWLESDLRKKEFGSWLSSKENSYRQRGLAYRVSYEDFLYILEEILLRTTLQPTSAVM
jgi:hypothetical protein